MLVETDSAIRPFREAMIRRMRRIRHNWQVFGLTGITRAQVFLRAVASQERWWHSQCL
ncbi:hypothetical protein MM1S1540310_4269 [Mycobacteroides abscessus subsp. bolletii 1S-154-0310]|nr:hypothetical protein MA4S0726RB_4063 [Mycobacteroides abscessus 4S-0726-RB]EIU40049.1 hypothetical protein MA6G0125R_3811 [Mycobacteroides abscessus 6G-0125-R]EIU58032.1 hypothetical protein MM1S1510930_4715 [Mycobacteroides abscessus subsp. bolletii 1S-151-0930]EIU67452.1 hypothetical protein MM1S1520914_4922 [Mycobacteroides abscessus subsp. bolletii 1S-152-0914]EIU71464.1 hypothetical protein MM1S1530915_4264 [Mycobacteroides abscessus subsp. bolletii 1S-153-0915]EIU76433.1 hypothetical 